MASSDDILTQTLREQYARKYAKEIENYKAWINAYTEKLDQKTEQSAGESLFLKEQVDKAHATITKLKQEATCMQKLFVINGVIHRPEADGQWVEEVISPSTNADNSD